MSFAKSLIGNYTSTKIGLIPAAVGGAPIDSFSDKGEFYHRSLKLLKQCKETSKANFKIKAILWLQGESDSTEESYQSYEDKLLNLVDRYREDLQSPKLPFIACTIGSFVHKGAFLYAKEINHILKSLPKKRKYTSVIDARDLEGHNGDHLHYDLSSQLEIGKRFANAYHALAKS